MAASGELHAGTLSATVQALQHARSRSDGEGLERLEAVPAASGEGRLRRLAVAALTAAARRQGGWSPERLERLRAYRRDRSLLVASAAQFTFPDEEEPVPEPDGGGLPRPAE